MSAVRRVSAIVALIAAVALLGPRARVEPSLPAADPASWRAFAAEDGGGVTPGAGRGIAWIGAPDSVTDLAIVYLHGFSATRREVHPLVDTLAARLGANVFYARLAGHGQAGDSLGSAKAADWLRDTAQALVVGRAIGRRVVLVGTSTGATLAAIAAAAPAPDLAAVVLASPNFGPRDPKAEMVLWPWGRVLTRLVAGEAREWTAANEAQAMYWTTRYPTRVIPEMMALVDAARRAPLERVAVPAYVVFSGRDQVISAERAREAARRFPRAQTWDVTADADSATVAELAVGSFHVFAGEILAPNFTHVVADSLEAFVRRAVR